MNKKIILSIVLIILILIAGKYAYNWSKNLGKLASNSEKRGEECVSSTIPWLKIISPNGGENYALGQQIKVEWRSCNVSADQPGIIVALHQNGEWKNVAYLSRDALNSGEETFNIPADISAGNYKMRIGSPSATVKQDYSDNFFTISSAPKVGGDRDAHGCIGSAGYSWCEIKNKCLRSWEEKCE